MVPISPGPSDGLSERQVAQESSEIDLLMLAFLDCLEEVGLQKETAEGGEKEMEDIFSSWIQPCPRLASSLDVPVGRVNGFSFFDSAHLNWVSSTSIGRILPNAGPILVKLGSLLRGPVSCPCLLSWEHHLHPIPSIPFLKSK